MRFRAFLAVVLELACGLAPSGLGSPLHRRDILGLGTASCVLGLPLPANPAASPSQFASPRLCDEAVTRCPTAAPTSSSSAPHTSATCRRDSWQL